MPSPAPLPTKDRCPESDDGAFACMTLRDSPLLSGTTSPPLGGKVANGSSRPAAASPGAALARLRGWAPVLLPWRPIGFEPFAGVVPLVALWSLDWRAPGCGLGVLRLCASFGPRCCRSRLCASHALRRCPTSFAALDCLPNPGGLRLTTLPVELGGARRSLALGGLLALALGLDEERVPRRSDDGARADADRFFSERFGRFSSERERTGALPLLGGSRRGRSAHGEGETSRGSRRATGEISSKPTDTFALRAGGALLMAAGVFATIGFGRPACSGSFTPIAPMRFARSALMRSISACSRSSREPPALC